MKHQIGEVGECRKDVLRQVVDEIVSEGQTQQVGQTVEGAVVEELDHVAGQVQHPQVVNVDERLTMQRLRSYTRRTHVINRGVTTFIGWGHPGVIKKPEGA